MKEAQSLHLRQHYGRGSKWRTRLALFGILALTLALATVRFTTEIAPKDRAWFLALAGVIFVGFLAAKRLTRRKADRPMQLEISEQELVFNTDNGRTAMPWSAFGQYLESPTLFVLLNRTKTVLWAVPKRAFPDEKSQDWFRTLANQLERMAAPPVNEALTPGRFAAEGITLTVQLGYRDYLTRMLTSWRTRWIAFAIFAVIAGTSLYSFAHPPPDAVVPPGKVFLTMMVTVFPMMAVVFFVVSFISWRSEKKFWKSEHVALTSEGIQFESGEGSGLLAWTTYKYYLENRWAFFIWNPHSSVWMMFPKREFASALDIEQCRELLQKNLRVSTWFYL